MIRFALQGRFGLRWKTVKTYPVDEADLAVIERTAVLCARSRIGRSRQFRVIVTPMNMLIFEHYDPRSVATP